MAAFEENQGNHFTWSMVQGKHILSCRRQWKETFNRPKIAPLKPKRTSPATQKLRRHKQRATALFSLHFLAVFSGFLSILIPFLTSCDPHPPCVPHLSVAFYVVKGKASPEQFRRGFAVFSAACFSTRWTTRKPHWGHPMRWDAIIKENRQHGVRYSGKSEAGKKTGVVCKERLHTIQ